MPHSILKKSQSSLTASTPPAARSREDRNHETALYHAQLIQERKDMEALILAATEALLEIPSPPSADPAHPSPSDATIVKTSLKPFQPSDYDELIEERNINRLCGYVLCPRQNRKQDTKAKYRILKGEGKGSDAVKFVLTQNLEKWCSDDCGKRALYIKVQLDEEPAWTRGDSSRGDIVLLEEGNHEEDHATSDMNLVQGMLNLDIGLGEDQILERMKALAIERGDGSAFARSRGLAAADIHENTRRGSPESLPEPPTNSCEMRGPHDSVEGYTPRFSARKTRGVETNSEGEDIMRTI